MRKEYKTHYILMAISLMLLLAAYSCVNAVTKQSEKSGEKASSGWKVIGPGGGGGLFDPTIDPSDPDHVLMRCDMTAGYVTRDGGKHWDIYNLWTVITDFEFVPDGSGAVYASTKGYLHDEDRGSGLSMLYRSDDGGTNWEIVYPVLSTGDSMLSIHNLQSSSLLPSQLSEGLPDCSIDKIAVDPENPDNIYLGMSPLLPYIGKPVSPPEGSAILMVSNDRGKTWQRRADLPGKKVLSIFPLRAGGNPDVIVITDRAAVEIGGGGRIIERPLPVESASAGNGGSSNRGTLLYILAGTGYRGDEFIGGMFRSSDLGRTWKSVNDAIFRARPGEKIWNFPSFGICEGYAENIYLAGNTAIPAENGGKPTIHEVIYRSNDAGETWKTVYLSDTKKVLSENFEGSWLNHAFGPGWGGVPISMGVSPDNPDICYGTDFGRAYFTKDGGAEWQQVYAENHPDGSYTGSGLDVTCCYGLHFDPFDTEHLAISYIDAALFQSFDGGKSWFHSIQGIPAEWVNTCYWLDFDPEVEGKMWSAWSGIHSLPRRSQFAPGRFQRGAGGVAMSVDGGKTWQKRNEGMPEQSVTTHILVDPESPVDSRILYSCVFDRGLYKSVDGGANWKLVTGSLGEHQYAWETRISGNRLFYLCVRGWPDDETIVNGAVYVSDDGAENWTRLVLPEGVNAPLDLLIDQTDPERMYLSCWPTTLNGKDINGGVYGTLDGGKSWKQLFDASYRVYAAALDPADPATIYINTFQNSAWRSDDHGQTWKRLEGYTFKWGHRPVPDPYHPGMIYLTTYGGSVFYGPAKGVAGAEGDVKNMPQNWW